MSFHHNNGKITQASKRASWLLTIAFTGTVQPNVTFFIKEAVGVSRVEKLITIYRRTIQHKHDKMVYAVNCLKNLGLGLGTLCLYMVLVVLCMS